MMQAVGRRYVRYFNQRQARTGTLWEGRYRSTLIQAERYLLACMAYIDLNPVRAGMVAEPGDYPWSSHAHYVGLRNDRLVTPHPLYWELGNTPFARDAAYAELVRSGISAAAAARADGLGAARLGAGRGRLRRRPAEAHAAAGQQDPGWAAFSQGNLVSHSRSRNSLDLICPQLSMRD